MSASRDDILGEMSLHSFVATKMRRDFQVTQNKQKKKLFKINISVLSALRVALLRAGSERRRGRSSRSDRQLD